MKFFITNGKRYKPNLITQELIKAQSRNLKDSSERKLLEISKQLSTQLKEQREQQGLSQTDLAMLMGTGQSRISLYESGQSIISLDTVVRAANVLGLSIKIEFCEDLEVKSEEVKNTDDQPKD